VLALRPAGAVIALVRTLRIRDLPFSPDFPYADAVLLEGTLEDLPRAVADAARTGT